MLTHADACWRMLTYALYKATLLTYSEVVLVICWRVTERRLHCHHTSAYVSIRQHTSAYGRVTERRLHCHHTSAYVSIRQHTSAYASIRQHTSAYVDWAYVSIRRRVHCSWEHQCLSKDIGKYTPIYIYIYTERERERQKMHAPKEPVFSLKSEKKKEGGQK